MPSTGGGDVAAFLAFSGLDGCELHEYGRIELVRTRLREISCEGPTFAIVPIDHHRVNHLSIQQMVEKHQRSNSAVDILVLCGFTRGDVAERYSFSLIYNHELPDGPDTYVSDAYAGSDCKWPRRRRRNLAALDALPHRPTRRAVRARPSSALRVKGFVEFSIIICLRHRNKPWSA